MVQWVTKEKRLILPFSVLFGFPGVRKCLNPSSAKCLLLLPVTNMDALQSHINILSFYFFVRF